MRKYLWGVSLLVLLMVPVHSNSQELSTFVIPTEDELSIALRMGEISLNQQFALTELMPDYASNSGFLPWDEIPNLSDFEPPSHWSVSLLQRDQRQPFTPESTSKKYRARISYRYASSFEEDAASRYRTGIEIKPTENLQIGLQLRKNKSGPDRVTDRHIRYRVSSGIIREVVMGNFRKRLGLGTIFGYRGLLLDMGRTLSSESFLFPHNGGGNGLYVKSIFGGLRMQSLISIQRDSTNSSLVWATMLQTERRYHGFRWGLVMGGNRFQVRNADNCQSATKLAIHMQKLYSGGYVKAEVTSQWSDDRNVLAAVVVEGAHRNSGTTINYAVWSYADDFVDLSAGSKSATVFRYVEAEDTLLSYRSRRAGQSGGLLRTTTPIGKDTRLVASFLAGVIDRDSMTVQFLGGVERVTSNSITLRVDLLARQDRRTDQTSGDETIDCRVRFEGRYRTSGFTARSYIAHHWNNRSETDFSFFFAGQSNTFEYGTINFWSRLSGWHPDTGHFRWYGFLMQQHELFEGFQAGIKLSHEYERTENSRNETTFSLQANFAI